MDDLTFSHDYPSELDREALDIAQEVDKLYLTAMPSAQRIAKVQVLVRNALRQEYRMRTMAAGSRDFWYRLYTRTSTHATKRIKAAFRDTLVLDFENDAQCEEILTRLYDKVEDTIECGFVTRGVKSAE